MADGAHHLRPTGAITEVEVYTISRAPRPPRPDALMSMSVHSQARRLMQNSETSPAITSLTCEDANY
jgi:hypothetical protein